MSELSQLVAKYPFKVRPFQHQVDGMKFYLEAMNRAIFMEMGCVSGSSELQVNWFGCGIRMTVKELYEAEPHKPRRRVVKSGRCIAMKSLIDGEYRLNKVIQVHHKGIKLTVEVRLVSGRTIVVTDDHEFLSLDDWIPARNLQPGDWVSAYGKHSARVESIPVIPTSCSRCGGTKNVARSPRSRYFGECRSCIMKRVSVDSDGRTLTKEGYIKVADPNNPGNQILEHILVAETHLGRKLFPTERVHHRDEDPTHNEWENLVVTEHHHKFHRWYQNLHKDIFQPKLDQVESVRINGEDDVYDIEMESPGNSFIANDILVHNCGKSKTAIDVAGFLFLCKKIQALVIIAPKGVYRNWLKKEIPEHMSGAVPYEFARWTSYMPQDDRAALATLMKPSSALKILAINIEALSGDPTKLKKGKYPALEYLVGFLKQYQSLVVCDESTTIKNPTAQRTKTVVAIGNKLAKNTMALSGNPIPQSPLDMYPQSEFLAHRTLPFENFYAFKNRFAITVPQYGASGKAFQKIVGFQDKQELRRLMRSFAFVVKKKDCLDLPEKLYQLREVEMGPLQKKAYNKMVADSFIELESLEIITANIVLTKMQKLHQIACGFIYDSDQNVVTFDEPNDRMGILLEDLEQIPQKAIIWSHFVPCIEAIVREVGKKFGEQSVAHFYGKTTDAQREEYKTLFEDPSSPIKFMVANPSSGKYGNTWIQGTTVYYYSNSNNLEDRQQSEDRSHRIGQRNNVLYVDLVVPDTEDERTLSRLRNKLTLSNEIVVSNWREMIGQQVA